MTLYLIQDDTATGDNSDLFVRAASVAAARAAWRKYYDLPGNEKPERVVEVPVRVRRPGAIGWDKVTQHKRRA